jgi:transcriptional regulator with XRE-family HTH domain/uncharacterized protein YidB (DUF937 family)
VTVLPKQERRLDLSDPVQAFARDLRRLRRQAGDPPVQALARALACEHSTISAYLNGYRLPPRDRLRAFLEYCKVPAGDRDNWDDRLRRAGEAVARYNALISRDEEYWRDFDSSEKALLTAEQIHLLLPTNSAAEIVDAINGLLLEERGASALKLIRQAIKSAPVPVVIEVMEAMSVPRRGFYAVRALSAASRWSSPTALFELVDALHSAMVCESRFRTVYEGIGSNPSKQAVAGLLTLLRKADRRNDILQILVEAAKSRRPEEVGDLLNALREAGQQSAASGLLEQLCKNRSVFFIRDVANCLRDNGQEDAAESLLGKARSALTA